MSPSAGERISSKSVTIKPREFPTRVPKERQFKVLGNTALKAQPQEGGATYVKFQMEPLNLEPGEANGREFVSLYTDSTPNDQGQVTYESENGALAFAQALGDELDAGLIEQEVVYIGKKLAKKGKESETLLILNPDELVDYIKAHDGATVTAYEGLKKVSEKDKAENPNWKDQNFIVRWIIPEQTEAPSGLPARRK